MSKIELPKAYDAKEVEDGIYQKWEESGFFNPDNLPAQSGLTEAHDPFVISMPPPNVTGILHLGHAFENSLMDVEVRYQRMKGRKAMIVPGTDHAAVATQARVEDNLRKAGIANPRQDLGREGLLEKIREYAENSKSVILSQIRKMGTSCDWSRLAYTFDEKRSNAVNELFKMMYADGLICKGYRVVNWSVKGQSTCSDDELEYIDQKTKVYTFKYSQDFPIPIATTRPETKLGDTAVAVNPKDDRYKQYIGQKFTVDVGAKAPLIITIIADEGVDINYGTGAVGVTPAHSQIDFEMYQKNKEIGLIPVIGKDGKMTEEAGINYQSLDVLTAREKFVSWLKEKNLFIQEEDLVHSVGTSDRFGDVVEALPMEQWFIDVNKKIKNKGRSLKELMREAVTMGHNGDASKVINITPDRFKTIYLHWIDNLRDWCISRQIWWGHRIPIWYCDDCKEVFYSDTNPGRCNKCESSKIRQDEDTLDTWFSSGAWTFSTLGWPDETSDLLTYHPTNWMQMCYEILFFWMARMILMTTYALDDIPFKDVYIHGMLRDKNGKKFSKSLGNGLDPIEIIEKYGTDALRFSLLRGTTPGNDMRFYEEKVEGARNFINKLWNISRFIIQSSDSPSIVENQPEAKTLADNWILSRLNYAINSATQELDKYNFSGASEYLYDFTWNDFADWYIEMSKLKTQNSKPGEKENAENILLYILQNILKLWHPFIPFVTEEIWQKLGGATLLMIEKWPVANQASDLIAESEMGAIKEIIGGIRNLRSENKIEPAKMVSITAITSDRKELLSSQAEIIKKLARLEKLNIIANGEKPKSSVGMVAGGVQLYLELSGLVDVEAEKKRIKKEIAEAEKYIKGLEAKLGNKEFLENAPEEIISKEKEKLEIQVEKIKKLKDQLAGL